MIKRFKIGQIPALLYADAQTMKKRKKGAVILYHGSSASKETHVKELTSLASSGFIAIGIDNVLHGERKTPESKHLFSHENPDMLNNMLSAIDQTACELPLITDFLKSELSIPLKRTSILGISMGAMIVYSAIARSPRIGCAVAFLGTPKYCNYKDRDYLKSYSFTRLLSINASKDQYISNAETRELHLMLSKRYRSASRRFFYREYPESDHFMLPCDWEDSWQASLSFLRENLS